MQSEPRTYVSTDIQWLVVSERRGKAGRAYLHAARVKLLREIEPGVVLIECPNLRHGALIFEPGEST